MCVMFYVLLLKFVVLADMSLEFECPGRSVIGSIVLRVEYMYRTSTSIIILFAIRTNCINLLYSSIVLRVHVARIAAAYCCTS